MTRHCATCEVGWTSTDVCCWLCGQPGEPGHVLTWCLPRPPGAFWDLSGFLDSRPGRAS